LRWQEILPPAGWLKEYLEGEQPVAELGRMLLMPSNKAPQNFKSRAALSVTASTSRKRKSSMR